jgi:hypothetical protein
MDPIKLRVLKGSIDEISKTKPVARPEHGTILLRGDNPNLPDLACGSCGAILVTGIARDQIFVLFACGGCGAVNEAVTKH